MLLSQLAAAAPFDGSADTLLRGDDIMNELQFIEVAFALMLAGLFYHQSVDGGRDLPPPP
jgi:hypothetical protein